MKIDIRLSSSLLRTDSLLFARVVRCLCEGVILANRAFLRDRAANKRPVPLLFSSGVYYQDEDHSLPDEAIDIPEILARGYGDCMHLCCYRVAELREQGEERARIRLTFRQLSANKRLFHVQVRRASGAIEDPSKILGM